MYERLVAMSVGLDQVNTENMLSAAGSRFSAQNFGFATQQVAGPEIVVPVGFDRFAFGLPC